MKELNPQQLQQINGGTSGDFAELVGWAAAKVARFMDYFRYGMTGV